MTNFVYVVVKHVPYEGDELCGIYSSIEGAANEAKRLCKERHILWDEGDVDPVIRKHKSGLEYFSHADIEWQFYKTEVRK